MEGRVGKKISDSAIGKLKQENEKLKRMVEIDWLTETLNRGAMECKVNEYLKLRNPGTILVMDLDYFKLVNDQYGHITGDQLLRQIGSILKKMNRENSLVGRVGGDEFAVFYPQEMDMSMISMRCEQIQKRMMDISLPNGKKIPLTVTMGWADSAGCRFYQELFDRADQLMMNKKRRRTGESWQPGVSGDAVVKGISQDLKLIMKELKEEPGIHGAYCQDYDTFKQLCRLELRRMMRKKADIYLILFTLTDRENHFLPPEKREKEMDILGEVICNCLRQGDVYTRYSSNQFLVLVNDVSEETEHMIAERIQKAYYIEHGREKEHVMLHQSYPLK